MQDIFDFLEGLKEEMNTQPTFSQAEPRYWTVMETRREYGVEYDYSDGCSIISDGEIDCEGDLKSINEWLLEHFFEESWKIQYKENQINITTENKKICCYDAEDIIDFLNEIYFDKYSCRYYRNVEHIVQNTMFITVRECEEHIKRNHYHYSNPRPFAMTAWRSPQVEKLYKILKTTDWKTFKEKLK